MCGRISLKTPMHVLARLFGVDITFDLAPRYNIAPTQSTLVIRSNGHARRAVMARWGFIPPWRTHGEKGPEPINARSESAAESRLFGAALRARRCVVPASGFYEWQAVQGGRAKRPFHIEPVGSEVFALAGLWSLWQPHNAEAVESFTILTCAPNEVMKPIHDRMPVILPMQAIEAWLDPTLDDMTTIRTMLSPASPLCMSALSVTNHVNNPKNDDPRCVEPAVPAPEDSGLFP